MYTLMTLKPSFVIPAFSGWGGLTGPPSNKPDNTLRSFASLSGHRSIYFGCAHSIPIVLVVSVTAMDGDFWPGLAINNDNMSASAFGPSFSFFIASVPWTSVTNSYTKSPSMPSR
jgi:hypothetical protein